MARKRTTNYQQHPAMVQEDLSRQGSEPTVITTFCNIQLSRLDYNFFILIVIFSKFLIEIYGALW